MSKVEMLSDDFGVDMGKENEMRNVRLTRAIACTMVLLASVASRNGHAQAPITPAEARVIAKEAYIFGNPLADGYRILYGYFVDQKDPDYKAPWNRIKNISRVYTSATGRCRPPIPIRRTAGWGWICGQSRSR
jgi:hypothetical protein